MGRSSPGAFGEFFNSAADGGVNGEGERPRQTKTTALVAVVKGPGGRVVARFIHEEFMAKVNTKAMTPDELRAWRSEVGRRGGLARAQQFTPASQRAARRRVSSESCRLNGKKGAARTIALHGYKALFEGSRRSRLANPSPCELIMMGLLKTLGLRYEREYVLGETLYTLDFYIAEYKLGIEVDGSIHDPGKPDQAKRIQHAERKAALCRCMRINLIRIHHSELKGDDLSGVIAKIEEIAGAGCAGSGRPGKTGKTGEPPVYGAAALPVGRADF